MNLFENIFDKFTKQAQPMPSFGTPQAPRTNSYVAPNIPYSEQNTGTGFGSITQPKPINTSLPMGIPEPVFQKDPSDELKKEFGFNDTDIEFLRQAKQEGYDSDMAFEYITKKKEQEKQNIYSGDPSVDNTFMNVVGGAVAEIPKVAGEVGSFLGKASQYMPANLLGTALEAGFTDKTYGQLREEQKAQAEQLATAGQAGKEFVQKYGAYNPKSTGANVGETITDIGSAFVGPNKAKLLKEGTGFVKGILPKTLNLASEGALAGAKYDVATKGEITEEGVGYGAGGNLVFGAGAKLLGKGYNALTSKLPALPAGITLGGLINPGKLDVVKKSLQVDEGVATPEDVGKWILDRVKPGNKQEIAEQLIQHAEKTKGAVDEALGSIPTYFQNPTAKKALLQIRNELEGKVGMEGKIAQIDELLAKPEYTLSELNAVKRELDDMYNMYTKTGDPTAGLKAKGLRNVRADLRKFIEDEAEIYGVNIRKLNNETATARGLAEGILRKDSADGVRELLTAFAPSGAGAVISGVGSYKSGNDVLTALRDAVIGGVATKFATSTAVRTRIASALNRLAPKDLTALENYIRSGGKDEIGKKVAEKVIKEGRALPARTITKPSDFAKTPEKSIITPQTQERAIIQESKKGLSPNIKRPNGNTNNTTSNSSNIPIGSKKVQEPIVKPNSTTNAKQQVNKPASKQVKPVEKTVKAMKSNFSKVGSGNYELIDGNRQIKVSIGGKDVYPNLDEGVYSVTVHENRINPDGTFYDPGFGNSGISGNREKIIEFLKKEGIDGKQFFQSKNTISKSDFEKATEKMWNNIIEFNGYKIARVNFRDKPWKIVDSLDFDEVASRGYKAKSFNTKEELYKYIKGVESPKPLSPQKTVKPNSTTNAKQPRNIIKPSTKSDSDIPEGYFKNAFGEIVKNPSNRNGGFIKVPGGNPIVNRASDVGIGTIESSKNIGAKIITSDGLPIYHGTSKSNAQSIKSKGLQILPEGRNNLTGEGSYGVSFSIDKNIGKKYADVHGGEVIEMKIPKGAKILQIDSKGNGIDETFTYNELEALSKKYDAILDISEGQEKEIRVIKNISKPISPQKTAKQIIKK